MRTTTMLTIYGIKNCDTMKKAMNWLTEHNIEFTFHDYRKDGIDSAWLSELVQKVDIDVLINKRGTTFRQLSDVQKQALNTTTAIPLLLEQPAMIKRPLLIQDELIEFGFKADRYHQLLIK